MSTTTLDDFCHHLMDDGPPRGRLQPGDVAWEFVRFFGLSPLPRFDELTTVLGRAGIRIVVCPDVPGGLRGYHTGTNSGSYEIRIDDSEWDGAQEHTVLHETYEIVRERVRDLLFACRDSWRPPAVQSSRPIRGCGADATLLFFSVCPDIGAGRDRIAEGIRPGLLVGNVETCGGDAGPAADGDPVRTRGNSGARLSDDCHSGVLQGFGRSQDTRLRGQALSPLVRYEGRNAPVGNTASSRFAGRGRGTHWQAGLSRG